MKTTRFVAHRWSQVAILALVGLVVLLIPPGAAACTGEFVSSVGGEGVGRLSDPTDLATDSEGNVWVADTGHDRVQQFSAEGEFLQQFGFTGAGNGQFKEPQGIAVDPEGDIWVLDSGNGRVQEFESDGSFIRKWNVPVGEFGTSLTAGIAVDAVGDVWLVGWLVESIEVEIEGFTVAKLTEEGELIFKTGEFGSGNGEFEGPGSIAADTEGNVVIADTGNNRVQELNGEGGFIRKYGEGGSGNGQLEAPRGIAVDSEDRVWVADTGNNRAQRFSPKGAYQAQFGEAGINDGKFASPQGIAVGTEGKIWVADTGNDRVQEWKCL